MIALYLAAYLLIGMALTALVLRYGSPDLREDESGSLLCLTLWPLALLVLTLFALVRVTILLGTPRKP